MALNSSILVTGAAGFVGSHIVEYLLKHTDFRKIIVLDGLNYAGRLDRIKDLDSSRVQVIHHDFSFPFSKHLFDQLHDISFPLGIDYIIHNGGETHVTRSVKSPESFVRANITGTFNILEAARYLLPLKFIYVSTDEVMANGGGACKQETDSISPSNIYSATKASGELLCHAYQRSFNVPIVITRTMNIFGERQHPEKFIPMTIRKVLDLDKVIIHGNSKKEVGSRQWTHAKNQASALTFLLEKGVPGEIYHIAGHRFSNLQMANWISDTLEIPMDYEIVDIHKDFPGHDLHYAIDDTKIRSLGWKSHVPFLSSLTETIQWYANNQDWLLE